MEKNEENILLKNLDIDDLDSGMKLSKLFVQSALKAFQQYKDRNAGLFLVNHFSNSINYDYNPVRSFSILSKIEKNAPGLDVLNWKGYFLLFGIGVEKDVDKAIDCFLECEKDENDVKSDAFLALIYIDSLNGYQNLNRGFYFVEKLAERMINQMKRMRNNMERTSSPDQDEMKKSVFLKEKIQSFLNDYEKALSCSDYSEAQKMILGLDKYQFALGYLLQAILYYKGQVFSKDETRAVELFHSFYSSFEDNETLQKAMMDAPYIARNDEDHGIFEMVDSNYPIHSKRMVDRYIRRMKEESDFGILSSMLSYGECYFGIYQDFPIDYTKSFEIFSDLYSKNAKSKAGLYLFFQYLYGFGTEKNIDKATELSKKIKEFDDIGLFMEGMLFFEKHDYMNTISLFLLFCLEENKFDKKNIEDNMRNNKQADQKTTELYARTMGYDIKNSRFLLEEALEGMKNGRFDEAYEKSMEGQKLGYQQAFLLLAVCCYFGYGTKRSLYRYKKYVNQLLLVMISTNKEKLIKNGYISEK